MNTLAVKSTNANLPFITRMKLIPAEDVVRIRNRNRSGNVLVTNEHRIPGAALILKLGYRIFSVHVPAGVCNFVEDIADSLPGAGYRQEIASVYAGDSSTIRHDWWKYRDMECIVIFEDAAGDVRLMGTKETPASLQQTFATNGTRGRNFVFSAIAKAPAYYLDGWDNFTIITTTDDGLETDYPV